MKNLIAVVFGYLITLCGSLSVSAEIIETNEIDKVLEYANQDSLVFFNITGTLYQPSNALSDNQWRIYFSKRVKELVADPQAAQALVDQTKNLIVQKIPKKTVEEKVPHLIADLQARKIVVLGLTQKQASTSYADNFAFITQNHLVKLGISLEKSLSYLKRDQKSGEESYTFAYGILFANKNPEGAVLAEFLKTVDPKPSAVIAVDNSRSSLENIQQALEAAGMKFIGLRYGRADAATAHFDATLGTIEFLTFVKEGKILSDAEAAELKAKQPDINYEALLDQYIKQ